MFAEIKMHVEFRMSLEAMYGQRVRPTFGLTPYDYIAWDLEFGLHQVACLCMKKSKTRDLDASLDSGSFL